MRLLAYPRVVMLAWVLLGAQLAHAQVDHQQGPQGQQGSFAEQDEGEFYKTCADQMARYHAERMAYGPGFEPNPPAQVRYSLEELLARTKDQDFEIKINAERVFQARERIKVNIGKIVPHLSFGGLIAILDNYYEVVASMIGFVYPSHWFQWKESRLFFEAERRSHAALVANQLNSVASAYFQVSYIKQLGLSFRAAIDRIDKLLAIADARLQLGEDRLDTVLRLQNVKNKLEQDFLALDNELRQLYYNLAYALNDPADIWNAFAIETVPLPDLSRRHERRAEDILPQVFRSSYELEQYDYLLLAAKYANKSRWFDFLSPTGDENAALGYGYVSHIRIGTSEQAITALKRERLLAQLALATYQAIEDRNFAVLSYRNAQAGLDRSWALYRFLSQKFAEGGEYDIDEFVDASLSIMAFESQRLSAQHKYLISRAMLDRLLLRGEAYQGLLELSPTKPSLSKSLRKRFENGRIAKALRKGEIALPKGPGDRIA